MTQNLLDRGVQARMLRPQTPEEIAEIERHNAAGQREDRLFLALGFGAVGVLVSLALRLLD